MTHLTCKKCKAEFDATPFWDCGNTLLALFDPGNVTQIVGLTYQDKRQHPWPCGGELVESGLIGPVQEKISGTRDKEGDT